MVKTENLEIIGKNGKSRKKSFVLPTEIRILACSFYTFYTNEISLLK